MDILTDDIELEVGQKFKVTIGGELKHGVVVEDASYCGCDPCMFIEKNEICSKMMCSRLCRSDGKLVHYEEVQNGNEKNHN